MKIKWYGTASISIESNTKLLIDPFVPMLGSKSDVNIKDYEGFTHILITHGHFDHISSLKRIYKRNKSIKIYCSETPYNYLHKIGIPTENLVKIKPCDLIKINEFEIIVYQGRHIMYDPGAIKEIASNIKNYKYLYNVPKLAILNKRCLENNETLFFDIKVENKHLNVMGSLGYDENIKYPQNCDLLVLPYQGKKDLITPALEIVNLIKPKKIILSHFDNTFPPVSKNIDTSDIENYLKDKIKVIKPKHKETINIGLK